MGGGRPPPAAVGRALHGGAQQGRGKVPDARDARTETKRSLRQELRQYGDLSAESLDGGRALHAAVQPSLSTRELPGAALLSFFFLRGC